MCRNIRPLYHFEPPVTDDEVRAASLQFVRKVSGFTRPSAANEPVFETARINPISAADRPSSRTAKTRRIENTRPLEKKLIVAT